MTSAQFEVDASKSLLVSYIDNFEQQFISPYLDQVEFVIGVDVQDSLGPACPSNMHYYHIGQLASFARTFKGKLISDLINEYNLRVVD